MVSISVGVLHTILNLTNGQSLMPVDIFPGELFFMPFITDDNRADLIRRESSDKKRRTVLQTASGEINILTCPMGNYI